jgi:hypothetical protein
MEDVYVIKPAVETGLCISALLAVATCSALHAQTSANADSTRSTQLSCTRMQADYPGIPDARTQISAATIRDAAGEIPSYCELKGYIAPSQQFELRLPLKWNGKYAQVGCGGMCPGPTAWLCDDPVRRGYACMAPDLGHISGADSDWARDNLQARMDFGFRGTHVAAVAGKSLAGTFYGKAPKWSYFLGSSTGGRLGMVEAERFPQDFNGILSGVPILNQTGDQLAIMWSSLLFRDKSGRPIFTEADIHHLHDAVLARCDAKDGLKDGLVGDPRQCDFVPEMASCERHQEPNCLNPDQVSALKKIYAGPTDSIGTPIYTGGMQPGSELAWSNGYLGAERYSNSADRFRNFTFGTSPPLDWKPEDFDWDHDYQRLGLTEALYSASNPDLRKLQKAHGKILMFQGWGDEAVYPLNTVDFYETTMRVMGGVSTTQMFFRLFMVPGMNHAGGNYSADSVDYLSYLEKWVEQDQAPDVIIAAHLKGAPVIAQVLATVRSGKFGNTMHVSADGRIFSDQPAADAEFTRPLYPYPLQAIYSGHGDPNSASIFVPAKRP